MSCRGKHTQIWIVHIVWDSLILKESVNVTWCLKKQLLQVSPIFQSTPFNSTNFDPGFLSPNFRTGTKLHRKVVHYFPLSIHELLDLCSCPPPRLRNERLNSDFPRKERKSVFRTVFCTFKVCAVFSSLPNWQLLLKLYHFLLGCDHLSLRLVNYSKHLHDNFFVSF